MATADGDRRVGSDGAYGKSGFLETKGFDAHRAIGDVEQAVVVGLRTPGETGIGVITDLHGAGRVEQVKDANSPVVIGVIKQAVADYRIVRADKRVGRGWSDAEGVHDFRLSGVCNVDDVKTALPTAEFLVQ